MGDSVLKEGRVMRVGMNDQGTGYRSNTVEFDLLEGPEERAVLREVWALNAYRMSPTRVSHAGVVVDIGGCFGAFAVLAAELGARDVHSYEPVAANAVRMRHHLDLNGMTDVVVRQEAVGTAGASFSVAGDSVNAVTLPGSGDAVMVGLDTVIERAGGEVDVLKVDCEGGEWALFDGATQAAVAACRFVTMEWHNLPNEYGRGDTVIPEQIGGLVRRLLWTHSVEVTGRPSTGGMLYATRY